MVLAKGFHPEKEVSRWAVEFEKMGIANGTYEPYLPDSLYIWVHLGGFILVHTIIRWARGLHGNSPLVAG